MEGTDKTWMQVEGKKGEGMPPWSEGDPTVKKEHEDRERSLLFVAATRARDQLIVTSWGTPSPFLAALVNKQPK
jgi:superfamily I DNA/RNA helicase